MNEALKGFWKALGISSPPPGVEAALHASGKRIVVVEEGEVKDDLVRDLLKVLTSACKRPMKRSARDQAKRILESICG